MKTINSIRNSFFALLGNLLTIIVGLFAQAIFIKILGAEYLGLNGLFTNIISMLGIVELGIGSAIIYNLYKPLSKNNITQVKSLLDFYRKAYNIIAIIVFIIGIFITPFLKFFIKEINVNINIYYVYILFVLDIVFSYILAYKRSILYADQKNYIITIIHISYLILLNTFQLIILYFTKNYYLYLIIKIFMRLFENVMISYIANRRYPYIKEKNTNKLDNDTKSDIFSKIKALFFHKLGSFIVLGTDNIIISKYLGLIIVGMYSNYYLIISALNSLIGNVINSLTPSIGHLLVEKNYKKNYDTFKKIRFANFCLTSFSATCLYILIEPFISLWIGDQFILPRATLIVLIINYYQKLMRLSYSTFKDAAGIFVEDKFIPLLESLLNIIFSIILVNYIGLPGVFIGTIISGLVLWLYSYPVFVYKKLFKRKYTNYLKETIGYIFVFLLIIITASFINHYLLFDNLIISLCSGLIISFIVFALYIIVFFYKTDNFNYYIKLLSKISSIIKKS